MRNLMLLGLLVGGVCRGTGNTCTLKSGGAGCSGNSCTASLIAADATHSYFTGTGCTANGYKPWANADNVIVPAGFTLTDDVGGTYGNYNGPVFSYISSLQVAPGSTTGCSNPTATISGGTQYAYAVNAPTLTTVGGVITAAALSFERVWYTSGSAHPTVTVTGGGCTFTGSYTSTTAITPVWVQGGGTPAISVTGGGTFTAASAITARGDIQFTFPSAPATATFVQAAGSGLTWDSSGTTAYADGLHTVYGFAPNSSGGTTNIVFQANGTSASHVTITSKSGGANSTFLVVHDCSYSPKYSITMSYTDLSNLGSAIDPIYDSGIVQNNCGDTVVWNVTHSTFTGVGSASVYQGSGTTETLIHQYNVHANQLGVADLMLSGTSTLGSGGTRNVSNNVFGSSFNCVLSLGGGSFNGAGAMQGVTLSGNYFGDSTCPIYLTAASLSGSLSYNLIRHYAYPGMWPVPYSALSFTGNYFAFVGPIYNPHLVSNNGSLGNVTWLGNVIDLQEDQTGGDTTYFFSGVPSSGPYTVSFLNNILLRTKQGHGQGWMTLSDTAIFGLNRPLTANHNIHWGRNTSGVGPGGGNYQGMVLIDHGGTTSQAVSSLKSNIEVGLGGGYTAFKMSSAQFNSPTTAASADMCTPSSCDYNAGYLLTYGNNCGGTQSTTCPNAGRGYDSKFTTTPGPHDPDYVLGLTGSGGINPQFADPSRNLATWDTAYLHHTASTGAWSAGQAPTASGYMGQGCTTAYHNDKDCDGYGVGTSPNDPSPLLGPDADDNDASVHTAAQLIAKWGTLTAALSHLGYSPLRQWFISTAGNDTTCAVNNASLPCATFAHVKPSLAAGDAVLWRAGVYSEGIDDSSSNVGTSVAPVLLLAYPGEVVSIQGGAVANIYIGYSSYITVDGFQVTNSNGLGYGLACGSGYASGNQSFGITVRNVELYNLGTDIICMDGQQNYLIEQNIARDSTGEHSMYFGTEETPANNVTIRHNLMYRSAANGLHWNGRGTNLLIDGNIIHSVEGAGLAMQNGMSHSVVQNNVVFQVETQAFQLADYWNPGCPSGPVCPWDQNYNVIENNTFLPAMSADWHGASPVTGAAIGIFHADSGGGVQMPTITGDLGHNTYRNNILSGLADSNYPPIEYEGAYSAGGANYYQSAAAPTMATDTWTDNILIGNSNTAVVSDGQTPGSGGYGYKSYTCAQFATMSTVSGCINSDPKFTALGTWNTIGSFNFALQSGSPAIKAGTATGAPAADIQGTTRVAPPDLGAYQYASVAYAVGQTASLSQAGIWGGSTINYRATAAHTASAMNQPDLTLTSANGHLTSDVVTGSTQTWTTDHPHGLSVGQLVYCWGGGGTPLVTVSAVTTYTFTTGNAGAATGTYTSGLACQIWRDWWEYASEYDLRTAIANGTTYTDGSINCVACLPVQAVVNWITAGHVVMNPALWLAGHDGQDVGAASLAPAQHMRFARRVP